MVFLTPFVNGKENPLNYTKIPDSLGFHRYFNIPDAEELGMIATVQAPWLRMSFVWESTEKEKGVYDFSHYDRLISKLEKFNFRIIFIFLSYGHPLYDNGNAPTSPEAREAFTQWATEAARHFSGKGIIWEMWNEPNANDFWRPKANVKDFIILSKMVGKAFKDKSPGEILVGPATSGFPWKFLKKCFQSGLLEYWSAVSVHPYRGNKNPESVTRDYLLLKNLIQKYLPRGKKIPILSGEWGYFTNSNGITEKKQGDFITRMFLNNLINKIPISIWFDWRNDGTDPNEKEHNFGIVEYNYQKNQKFPYKPKLAFSAAKNLIKTLQGFNFKRRIGQGNSRDFILEFFNNKSYRWVYWTSSNRRKFSKIPTGPGNYKIINNFGETVGVRFVNRKFLPIEIESSPKFLIPIQNN